MKLEVVSSISTTSRLGMSEPSEAQRCKTPQRKETGYRQIAVMLRCASEGVEGDAGSMMGSIFVSTEYIYNQIFSPSGEIL